MGTLHIREKNVSGISKKKKREWKKGPRSRSKEEEKEGVLFGGKSLHSLKKEGTYGKKKT